MAGHPVLQNDAAQMGFPADDHKELWQNP